MSWALTRWCTFDDLILIAIILLHGFGMDWFDLAVLVQRIRAKVLNRSRFPTMVYRYFAVWEPASWVERNMVARRRLKVFRLGPGSMQEHPRVSMLLRVWNCLTCCGLKIANFAGMAGVAPAVAVRWSVSTAARSWSMVLFCFRTYRTYRSQAQKLRLTSKRNWKAVS